MAAVGQTTNSTAGITNSLLEGDYDEADNAASFADALAEWRGKKAQILAANQNIAENVDGGAEKRTVRVEPREAPVKGRQHPLLYREPVSIYISFRRKYYINSL